MADNPERAADPAQTPTVTRRGVRINPAVPKPTPKPEPVPDFISEGVAKQVESDGQAVDPRTGLVLTEADLPPGRQPAGE